MASAIRRFAPLFDRVLVEKVVAETKTKSGILLPDTAKSAINEAKVLAVGPGIRNMDGKFLPMAVKEGDVVILPEFGGSKLDFGGDKEYFLFREQDILAVKH